MKKKLGALLRVLVSVGILAWLFNSIFHKEAARYFQQHGLDPDELGWTERARIVWTQGPQALWEVFQHVHPGWLAMAIGSVGIVSFLGIIRWRMLLRVQGLELSFARATSITFIGQFFNAFMLGATGGDVIKAWYVAHETHHKKAEAVATVVVDRLIGLLGLFVIALLMMAVYYHRVFDDLRLRSFAILTLAAVLATVLGTIAASWRGLTTKFPRLRARLMRWRHYPMLKRMIDAYRVYASHPVVLGKTMGLTVGVHVFSMLSIVFVGWGLGLRTANGLIDYFLYLPIINSVTAIPITISGFGVRELMCAQMFGRVGVSQSQAVALSLLGYMTTLFWSLVGGVCFLTHRKELPPAEVMVATD